MGVIPVEAIERVIDYLETRSNTVAEIKAAPSIDPGRVDAACRAYSDAINELRKVLDDHGQGKP